MPPIIIGIAIALSVGPLISVGVITSIAVANALVGFGLSMVLGGIGSMLTHHPSATTTQSTVGLSSTTVSVRQPVAPRVTQYGLDRRGGIITFIDTTGASNEFLHLVITLTGHQVTAINNMYFDGVAVPIDGSGDATGKYTGFVHVEKKLGAPGEPAFPGLVAADGAKWTANHRQDGCASVYVRLKWSADLFPTGLPAIKFDIQGKLVLDPRNGLTGYSENVALCLRDYLIATKANDNALTAALGLGDDAANIDDDLVIAAANICDEELTKKDLTSELRYTCDGSFSVDQIPRDIIPALLSAMAGTLVYSEGMWKMYAAAWRPPTLPAFTDSDARDSIKFQPLVSRRDLANSVKGQYKSPLSQWQPDNFPAVTNAAAVAADGENIWLDLQLPFTISASMAQRIAKIQLMRIRNQGILTFPGKLTCYQAEVCDVVPFTRPRFGWTNKNFEVSDCQLKVLQDNNNIPFIGCDLVARETDSTVYDWDPATEETTVTASPSTSLPDPGTAQPPTGMTIASDTLTRTDGVKITRVRVTWNEPADQFVIDGGYIEIQRRDHADMVWRVAGKTSGFETLFFDYSVNGGHTYDYKIRSEHAIGGVFSTFVELDGLLVADDGIAINSSGGVGPQGSIRPSSFPVWTVATNSNDGAGNCTVRLTAPATTLPLTDGTTVSFPAVDKTWTGLAATTTYLFAPRYKIADGTVHFATGTGSNVDADPNTAPLTSGATQAQKNQLSVNQSFDGYLPMSAGYITVTTPNNAGTGGGSSGGDPTCVHESAKVSICGCIVDAIDAQVGDLIKGKNLRTGEYIYRRIMSKQVEVCSDWYEFKGVRSTPCHPLFMPGDQCAAPNRIPAPGGQWVPFAEAEGSTQIIGVPGIKVSLGVEGDSFDDHNFIVFCDDGTEMVVHNPVLPRS